MSDSIDTRFPLDFPALDGRPVTQRHASYCAEHGHATYTNDGVVASWCPRCGEDLPTDSEVKTSRVATVVLTIAEGMSELDPLAVAILAERTDRTSLHVAVARPADVDVRAEHRVWGSYPRAMAALTGKGPERGAVPAGTLVVVGRGVPFAEGGGIVVRGDVPFAAAEHKPRIYVSDHGRGFYSWRCSCGKQGAPDILHREYARDAWREAHGLEPQVNRPLV